ncbi:hypothetical protein D9M73_175130 [compost metagenome]
MNDGRCWASAASTRDGLPRATAPQALPMATCGRSMLAPSSRCRATRWPPASSTATVSGAADSSRAVAKALRVMSMAVSRLILFIVVAS